MREIDVKGGAPREIAVVEDGRLVEYLRDDHADSAAETIYLGLVDRVVPGMKVAFVDIGQEKRGFLPLEEKSGTAPQQRLQCGMRIPVQVKREAHDQKGAFLTRDVTLCGQYVILMPMNRYVGISAKVEDAQARRRLQQIGEKLTAGAFGLVMRTAAAQATEEEIAGETAALQDTWRQIASDAAVAHAPSVIWRGASLLDGVLRDYGPRGIDRAVTDDAACAEAFRGVCPVAMAEPGFMDRAGLTVQRDKALERFVWLRSGGSLVIDQCEAMTVIDVNTGKFTGKRLVEETIRQLNLEACAEIARQTRLRNLGGVIVIDFIDMAEEADRDAVREALAAAFQQDRVKTVIHGFTALGLMEMTRKRSRRALRDEWTAPCRACGGLGRIKEERHG